MIKKLCFLNSCLKLALYLHTLASLSWILLPNLHSAVVTARRQPLSCCVKAQTPDGGRVSLQSGPALPVVVLLLVNADVVVVTGRSQEL